jgi:uncharacterized protein (DUF2147 family)
VTDLTKVTLSGRLIVLTRLWLTAAWVCGSVAIAGAAAKPPTGRWITSDGSAVIQIAPCGAELCGQIVGLAQAHPGDPMPANWQGQPECGEVILQTAPATDGTTSWVGQITDPRNGNVYQASVALDANRHLELHGYVVLPIFGQTQTWYPYAGRTLAGCKLAAAPAPGGNA